MADDCDWRNSLTASQRYDNIQNLTQALAAAGLPQSAFEVENEAYKTAGSREEYDAACKPSLLKPGATTEPSTALSDPAFEHDDRESSPGVSIGSYQNCHYIASGVTSAVYRAEARALKVIVETHNIEPHNPYREAKILSSLRNSDAPNIIPLLETFRDSRTQDFVLVFPYAPLTLADLLASHRPVSSPLPDPLIRTIFTALFRALHHIHSRSIIHRDIKPSALLLTTPTPTDPSQVHLSDFGTAWHPTLSTEDGDGVEPADDKILDVGTGPYRAPEALFGDRAYGPALDLWAAGATLAECFRRKPLFDSRPAHEDGNQLGLVLSIFQTLGTPTPKTWPEAARFRTPPFEMYRIFEGRVASEGWQAVVPGLPPGQGEWMGLVEGLLRFESAERITAREALEFPCMNGQKDGAKAS
ncbi:kinase-like domain-containing protein [Corynascus novoguineensis]|uniref:cyclin-dependent kinase n=1 Tax=Corynascus novoguineensis TaxID=1126955 RepID=A0AAN7HGF6_9PEZI|nr:kinase-like domain-containing protein [Corynascus novoguineensis]